MTPTPTLPTWKLLKSTSMSQQCRLLALSASNDVAGTWKRFSAASTSVAHSLSVPLHDAANPTNQEAQEVPKHANVQGPRPWFLHFLPPNRCEVVWNEQRGS